MKYRPEIDGLRAVAVLAVVLYHAGLGGAGFVGVDVFFVISGYLITSLLLAEHARTGAIDFLAFYGRRVRRIVPAATFVVLATMGASSLLLSPADLARVADSAAAAGVFGANVFFQVTTGGYFDPATDQLPLLHLWSLSVEEQFYLVWPALLALMLRYRPGRLLPVLVGLAVVSFVAAEVFTHVDPEVAFYQTPLRFWELAAGGIVAALPTRGLPWPVGWIGLVGVLAACVWPLGHFPGLGALPGVAGAVVLLAAIHGGARNALLSSPPVVGLGRISYSLYLWHWPLLALYRATTIGEGSLQVRLELCAVAVLLAIASYRYVEQPFRRAVFPSGRLVTGGFAVSIALAAGACAWGYQLEHQPGGVAQTDNPLAVRAEADLPRDWKACHYFAAGDLGAFPKPGCGQPGARMALWGDSYGESWQAFAWALAAHEGLPVTAFHYDGCPALLGLVPTNGAARDLKCLAFNDHVAAAVKDLDTVVVVTRWSRWLHTDEEKAALQRTLQAISGVRRVLVIGPTPDLHDSAPKCIRAHSTACDLTRAEFDAVALPLRQSLEEIARPFPNVEIVDPTPYFCPSNCPAVLDGVPLYRDAGHPTATATRTFAGKFLTESPR